MIKASNAKKASSDVRSERVRKENDRKRKADEEARKKAKRDLPRYLAEVEAEIRKAVKEGYGSTSIRLPGYEDSEYAHTLAYELSEKLKKHGYTTDYKYYRTHDIEYQDDHWSFEVYWEERKRPTSYFI